MSQNFDDDEIIFFRQLTPEELLQTQNQQTILTPAEKFARVQKTQDKRARRLRKYHFTAIESKNELYIFDGEGVEIMIVENSVKACRLARVFCLYELFLKSPNQNGGYSFSGPHYDNLSEEDEEKHILATYKNLDFHRFSNDEILSGEYEEEKKNYCYNCETQFKDKIAINRHICTDAWMIAKFNCVKRQYFYVQER